MATQPTSRPRGNARGKARAATPEPAPETKPVAESQPVPEPQAAAEREAYIPLSPAQVEAEGTATIVVDWRGFKFRVVADPDEWNFWTVTTPAARGNKPALLYGLLGDEAMSRLREVFPTMTAADGADLYDTIERAIGFASGKG